MKMKENSFPMGKTIRNNFHMLRTVYQTDAGYLAFTLLVRMLSAIAESLLYVYLLGAVIYCVENGKAPERILLLLLAAMAFLAAVFMLQAYYDHIFRPVHRERIADRLQQGLFHKLQTADMASYDSAELYTKVTLASEEIATRPLEATDNLFRGFQSLIATCTIIAGTIPANWFVFAICMVSFAAGAILTKLRSGEEVEYDGQMKRKDKKLSLLRRLLYLPEYGKDNRLSKIHNAFLADYKNTLKEKENIAACSGRRIAYLAFWQKTFCSAFCIDFLIPLYLSIVVLLWGKLSIAAFVIAVNAGDQIQRRLEEFMEIASDFLKNGRFAERIRDIDSIPCHIENTAAASPMQKMETLNFRNVCFQYPDGTPGLQGIDLAIRKGSKVAIVGRNGSGKTTLIKLLLRFYDASSGSILLNGRDIRSFDVSSYRRQFGTAFQDFNIYAASLAENVCMGEEADRDRLLHALERAGLYRDRTPLGMDTAIFHESPTLRGDSLDTDTAISDESPALRGDFLDTDTAIFHESPALREAPLGMDTAISDESPALRGDSLDADTAISNESPAPQRFTQEMGCGIALEAQLTRELDERGILLSGGQLQRLALARVFYRESDIIVMDEPTAAMDVFFEREFYRTVFEQLKDKTVIFVSHRLSCTTACDHIVYMEHGQILEQGTHDRLMALQGGYYRLFQAQLD